jgi:hypothetical protein
MLVADGPTEDVVSRYLVGEGTAEAMVSLEDSVDRRGTGEARVVRASLVDEYGRSTTRFLMGQRLGIEFDVAFGETNPRAIFAVTISSLQGVRVINWVSVDSGIEPDSFEGKVRVRASLPDLPLYPGGYAIERIWVGAPSRVDCYDEVNPSLSFEVEQSQHGSRHRPLLQRMGLVQLPIEAEIIPAHVVPSR